MEIASRETRSLGPESPGRPGTPGHYGTRGRLTGLRKSWIRHLDLSFLRGYSQLGDLLTSDYLDGHLLSDNVLPQIFAELVEFGDGLRVELHQDVAERETRLFRRTVFLYGKDDQPFILVDAG